MLTITCSSCQKKLSVNDDLAGKKIKCPACGHVVAAPMQTVGAKIGAEDPRTAASQAKADPPTVTSAAQADASESPTNPSHSNPEATQGIKPDADHDSSLTDFLAPPQADDELGRLGDYRILKILGHGGMGVVFLGEDSKLGRKVAIKVMLPHLAQSKSSQQRFLREAKAAAALEHDNIVPIFQVDEDRGAPYIVMPFLKGEPLDERLKRAGLLPLAEVLRIGREVARALAAAHKTGLVHRDIKPANIWLEAPEARVKILDFGLARAVAEDSELTQQGTIVGTPAYMAPEQGRGEHVDARSDLWSLGVVLYRMCAGEMPFKGANALATLRGVETTNPPSPAQVNADVPPGLSEVVMKLLEKNPADRVSSAAEVVQVLQVIETKLAVETLAAEKTAAIAAGEPSPVRGRLTPPTSSTGPLRGSARRKPVGLIALTVGIFGALLLGAGGVYYWQTNNGTVRIEINDPDIKVAFDKNGPIISGVDQKDIKLTPGEFGLRVERGDLKFDTDKFILKRGETITLKIEWFKEGKLQVVQGEKVIGAKELPKVDVAVGPQLASGTYALQFDGARSRVQVKGQVPVLLGEFGLQSEKAWTVECYATPIDVDNNVANVFETGYGFSLWASDNKKNWVLKITPKEPAAPVVAVGEMQIGRKDHLAAVHQDGQLRLFVNGKMVAPVQVDPATLRSVFKNTSPRPLGHGFSGQIQEVRLSKTARYDKDFTPAQRFEPDADTLALYHFDEGSGDVLKDSSGNGHHGKIVGAKWVKADGTPIPSGTKTLQMGGGKIEVASLAGPGPGDFTLEAFFTFSTLGENASLLTLIGFHSTKVWIQMPDPDIADTPRIIFNATCQMPMGNGVNYSVTTGKISANRRTHLACVKTDKELRVYLDGRLAGKKKWPGGAVPPAPANSLLQIGRDLNGFLEEVRISKVARYTKDFTPQKRFEPDADTLALYHCDEGSGDVLKDSSGNNHHGKIVGAKWVNADGTPIAASTPEELAAKKQQDDWAAKLKVPVEAENKIGMKLRLIPPAGAALPLLPQKAFYLGKYEVTQGEWQKVMGYNPSFVVAARHPKLMGMDTSNFPVDSLSWYDSVEFCNKLSILEGLKPYYELKVKKQGGKDGKQVDDADVKILGGSGYHIPTDAEWEHGCRAWTTTKFHFGDKDEDLLQYGWFDKNSEGRTHPVGAKKPNAFGLFDMHGNLNEWNEEMLTNAKSGAPERVRRGGSWNFDAFHAQVNLRERAGPGFDPEWSYINGLRVARAADSTASASLPPPPHDAWHRLVAAMPAEQQVKAVADKLHDRNLAFDAKTVSAKIDKAGVVTDLEFVTDNVTDISPVRALTGLQRLKCGGTHSLLKAKGKLEDLTPLTGLKLTALHVPYTKVSNLAPLKDMPLTELNCHHTKVADLTPLKNLKLTVLDCGGLATPVANFAPLQGMPLVDLRCNFNSERDGTILRSIKTLKTINGKSAAEFWAEVDAK